jgi:hypothetical protein
VVRTKGRGLSFQVLIQPRMSLLSWCTEVWVPRRSFLSNIINGLNTAKSIWRVTSKSLRFQSRTDPHVAAVQTAVLSTGCCRMAIAAGAQGSSVPRIDKAHAGP